MKNLFKYTIALFAIFVGVVVYAGEKTISQDNLPSTAINFIKDNFPQANVVLATKDGWWITSEYDVSLSDSTSIDFDSSGNWKEIKNSVSGVSTKFLPEKIRNTLEIKFIGSKIKSIEKKSRYAFEIELFDGRDLKFDKNGVLFEVDD